MKRHTDRYITARLRRIEWFVKAGRIEQARDALTLLRGGTCGMAGRLNAWAKRIAAIEESFGGDPQAALRRKLFPQIPADFPVKPLLPGEKAEDQTTCFTCGLSWDDAIITSMTPAPGARCPFEEFHAFGIYRDDPIKRDDPEHAKDKPAQPMTFPTQTDQDMAMCGHELKVYGKAAQHTPGPWFVGQRKVDGICINGPSCTVAEMFICGKVEESPIIQANARLIAAAPELLEACKALSVFFGTYNGDGAKAVLFQARTAIAKAEARS